MSKSIKWRAIAILLSLNAVFGQIAHAVGNEALSKLLKEKSTCGFGLSTLEPWEKALKRAPSELKEQIRQSALPLTQSLDDWWPVAIDTLLKLGESPDNLALQARGKIQQLLHQSPAMKHRAGANPILALPSPALNDGSRLAFPQTLGEKLDLERFLGFRNMILRDFLPEEYSRTSSIRADWFNGFPSPALKPAFDIAHRFHFESEKRLALMLMFVHEQYDDLVSAAHVVGDDQFTFNLARYFLARVFLEQGEVDIPKDFGWAVTLLSSIYDPALRIEAHNVLVTVAGEIYSAHFREGRFTEKVSEPLRNLYLLRMSYSLLKGFGSFGADKLPRMTEALETVLGHLEKVEGLKRMSHFTIARSLLATGYTNKIGELLNRLIGQKEFSLSAIYAAALGGHSLVEKLYAATNRKNLNPSQIEDFVIAYLLLGKVDEALAVINNLESASAMAEAKRRFPALFQLVFANSNANNFELGFLSSLADSFVSPKPWQTIQRQAMRLSSAYVPLDTFLNAAYTRYLSNP